MGLTILQGLMHLLPMGEKAGRMIPVGFYLALLSRCMEFGLQSEVVGKLQDQIASMLPLAHLDELTFPKMEADRPVSGSIELAMMEAIFSAYVCSNVDTQSTPPNSNSVVANLWDAYLAYIAADPSLSTESFTKLIDTIPQSYRQRHDGLYRALDSFLQSRRGATQEEKSAVCKYLSCQKLSQEVCIEAVQNELMPLRLIVQALFIQQLNTHQAFKECSDSFRYTKHHGEFSGSMPILRSPFSGQDAGTMPLSTLLQTECLGPGMDIPHKEYESTSFRIQSLEQELMSLKRSLQDGNNLQKTGYTTSKPQDAKKPCSAEKRSMSRRMNLLGQMTSCISSANRLVKLLRRMNLFGTKTTRKK
ncbi:hypothetical protein MLD38_009085 [Melastoma candidum]|uniref:Uncharacterized protein n=1 Tax=Melastoma candidum TaxID=119954 RepID=A0ACB9RWD3_9MYRT|nr:hypothetical protein MLD38_009085 [Melastoma candidum]